MQYINIKQLQKLRNSYVNSIRNQLFTLLIYFFDLQVCISIKAWDNLIQICFFRTHLREQQYILYRGIICHYHY